MNGSKALSMLGIALAASIGSAPSFAQIADTTTPNYTNDIGPLLGISFATNGGGTNIAYGLEADHKFFDFLSGGLYFTHTPLGAVTVPNGTENSRSLTNLAAQANYYGTGMLE